MEFPASLYLAPFDLFRLSINLFIHQDTKNMMRTLHRYLGFFLAGIMAVYALSGIVLIFRNTDFLRSERLVEQRVEAGLTAMELKKALKLKKLETTKEEGQSLYFNADGIYDKSSGLASYTAKELPYVLGKMVKLHKARSGEPLYYLNIFFGFSLLFFVISSFFMFAFHSSVQKKGLLLSLAGMLLTLFILFF